MIALDDESQDEIHPVIAPEPLLHLGAIRKGAEQLVEALWRMKEGHSLPGPDAELLRERRS